MEHLSILLRENNVYVKIYKQNYSLLYENVDYSLFLTKQNSPFVRVTRAARTHLRVRFVTVNIFLHVTLLFFYIKS